MLGLYHDTLEPYQPLHSVCSLTLFDSKPVARLQRDNHIVVTLKPSHNVVVTLKPSYRV